MPETTAEKKPAAAKKPAKPRRSARVKAVEEAARTYFDAVTARDPDAMAACWHPEGVEDIIPLGVFRGPEAVRVLFSELFRAMPDFELTATRITADHEVAAVQWRSKATFTGARFQGIEPTGRRIELRGTDCLEIDDDGRITRNTAVFDGAALARGIGMLPPENSGAEKAMRGAFNAVTKLRQAVEGAR
jgi:predicted ester cyclase